MDVASVLIFVVHWHMPTIVLLAQAAAAMRTMLKICEDYAQDFDVIIIIIIIIYSFIKMQHKMTMHNW